MKPLDSLRLSRGARTILKGGTVYEGLPPVQLAPTAEAEAAEEVAGDGGDAVRRRRKPAAEGAGRIGPWRRGARRVERRGTPGSSAAWLARHVRDVEAGSSNLPSPTASPGPSSRRSRTAGGLPVAQGCDKAVAELEIHFEPPAARADPTLGIAVAVDRTGTPPHRLVTVGDSITQGFTSLAVFRTDLSWPAIVARQRHRDDVQLPGLRGTGRPGRAAARPRAARPRHPDVGRADVELERPPAHARPAALLHGRDRGLLGAGLGGSPAASRPTVPQPGRVRLGPARHAGPERRPPATAHRRGAAARPTAPSGGRERQRSRRARGGGATSAGGGRAHGPAGGGRPRCRRRGRTRDRDPGRHAGGQQRARHGRPPEGVLEHRGLPGRASRPPSQRQARLHGLAAVALRGRVGGRRRGHRARRCPPCHRGHRPRRDHPAREPRRRHQGAAECATSRTTRGRGSPTPTSIPAAIRTSPRTTPGHRLRHRRLQRRDHRVRPSGADGGCDWYLFDLGGLLDSLAAALRGPDPAARPPWWGLLAPAGARRARSGPHTGSSSPARTAASTAACSRSTGPTRPRSATGSSPRRSSGSWSWRASPSTAGRAAAKAVAGRGRLRAPRARRHPRVEPALHRALHLDLLSWLDQLTDWASLLIPFGPLNELTTRAPRRLCHIRAPPATTTVTQAGEGRGGGRGGGPTLGGRAPGRAAGSDGAHLRRS